MTTDPKRLRVLRALRGDVFVAISLCLCVSVSLSPVRFWPLATGRRPRVTGLRPGTEVRAPCLEDLADRDRGVDETDVSVGLRKIAEQPPVWGSMSSEKRPSGLAWPSRRLNSETALSISPIIASASTTKAASRSQQKR
jgi:hypothetical protein